MTTRSTVDEQAPTDTSRPDLRLAGPAVGAWLTALCLLTMGPAIGYLTAGALLACTGILHVRPVSRWQSSRSRRSTADPASARPRKDPERRHLKTATTAEPTHSPLQATNPPASRETTGLRTSAMSVPARATGSRAAMAVFAAGPTAGVAQRGRRAGVRAAAIAVLVCAAASAAGVALRQTAVASGPVRALAMKQATAGLSVVVTGDPRALPRPGTVRHRETVLVPARVEQVGRWRVRVPVLLLAGDPAWKRVLPSQHVHVIARLSPPRPGELLAAVALVRGPPVLSGSPSFLQRTAAVIRARLRNATDRLPSDEHAVLPALVDGDTSLVPPDLSDAFAKAGLTHLMAVSGENLSLLIGAVLAIGRFAGLGRRATPVVAGLAILGFVVVARPSPSVLRAATMGAVALIAVITGREHRGIPALCAAVLVLVLIDPELARSYGFALSAVATAGILLLAPRWRRRLSERMPRRLAEPLAVSAAAQAFCVPLLVMFGEGIDLVAVPANLLAAPAVGLATLLGVLTALVAPVSLPAARLIALPAGFAVGWITDVARVLSLAPYTAIGWPAGLTGAVLVLVAFALFGYVVRRPAHRKIASAVLIGVVLSALGVRLLAPGWPPHGWRFVVCDVGQGDGLALFTGPGEAVVVDTGPDPRPMDRCLRDLGVRAVPLLVLTHPHADHVDGIPGVLHGRAVGTIVISPDSEGEERRLLSGRPARTTEVGDLWTIGPLTLTVLGPLGTARVSTRDTGTNVNNTSVVLLARWPGLTVLLCGDVEIEAQRELLAEGVPAADVLKIPHHGSSHQDPAFLAAVHARIAIASVGAGNDYGHPAPSTMTELARLGDRTYRTDRDGDVAVIRTGSGLAVVSRHAHRAIAEPRRTIGGSPARARCGRFAAARCHPALIADVRAAPGIAKVRRWEAEARAPPACDPSPIQPVSEHPRLTLEPADPLSDRAQMFAELSDGARCAVVRAEPHRRESDLVEEVRDEFVRVTARGRIADVGRDHELLRASAFEEFTQILSDGVRTAHDVRGGDRFDQVAFVR